MKNGSAPRGYPQRYSLPAAACSSLKERQRRARAFIPPTLRYPLKPIRDNTDPMRVQRISRRAPALTPTHTVAAPALSVFARESSSNSESLRETFSEGPGARPRGGRWTATDSGATCYVQFRGIARGRRRASALSSGFREK